jgi:hypothetical protein
LYDLVEDPHELNNLAADSTLAELKQKLRRRLEEWIEESGDVGFEPKHPGHVEFFEDYRKNSRRRYASQREKMREAVRNVVEGANIP